MTRGIGATALLLGLLAAGPAVPQGIADRVPLDDPTLAPSARRDLGPPASQPNDGSYVAAAVASALDTAFWAATGIVRLPSAASQFMWELSYVLGVNSTPVRPPRTADAVPPPPIQPTPPVVVAPPPVAIAPAPTGVEPVAAAVLEPPRAPVPTSPIGPKDEVDRGLVSNFVYDRSSRREDGTFFVPKPLQRLFNVRTEPAKVIDMPSITRMPGRIVPDPTLHGAVQPSVAGRLEPPDDGLPVLGQVVRQGQLLAWVSPSIGVVDRSQVRRDVARLTTDIRTETEALEILRQFSWVPFREGKIYQAEQRLAGLRRERDALLPMLELREALRAPTDGVISDTDAVNGRIVQPGATVFEVIDPTRLWVEATAPDPGTAEMARDVPLATAATPEGANLTLRFVGTGLSVARQATPVLFRIDNPPAGLRVGRPVTVTVVNPTRSERGVLVNRAAVTQGSSGIEEVWEQKAAELFVPHPVRTRVIDGASVLVLDGVPEGARIVINGSRLMAQLQ